MEEGEGQEGEEVWVEIFGEFFGPAALYALFMFHIQLVPLSSSRSFFSHVLNFTCRQNSPLLHEHRNNTHNNKSNDKSNTTFATQTNTLSNINNNNITIIQ